MGLAKQLYELQELDLAIEGSEQSLARAKGQLGESVAVLRVREKLAAETGRLEELQKKQHDLEWEIDDLGAKIKGFDEELYSGRIKNPKELANLQQDVQSLKAKRSGLEDKAIEVMEAVEEASASVASTGKELKAKEAEWRREQEKLAAEITELTASLTKLREKREQLVAEIDAEVVTVYGDLRKRKGVAIARVEQGVCRGCRLSLSNAELQRVRGGSLVECSSCGRILFLA
jgi:predicted  nucleic acid-binding Zn-ribbon protein